MNWFQKLFQKKFDPQNFTPQQLQTWCQDNLPYLIHFFDCEEWANFGVVAWQRRGAKAEKLLYYIPDGRGHWHILVDATNLGYGKFTMLNHDGVIRMAK